MNTYANSRHRVGQAVVEARYYARQRDVTTDYYESPTDTDLEV